MDDAAASCPPADGRDDADTLGVPSVAEFRVEGNPLDLEADGGECNDQLNETIMDDALDINSVLSGQAEETVDFEGVFGRNLGSMFDDANEAPMEHLRGPTPDAPATRPQTTKPPSAGPSASRPPLPPGRPGTAGSATLKSTADNAGRKRAAPPTSEDDKRLSVFLRVRPPVCAAGTKGHAGAMNTIEVLPDPTGAPNALPQTIRTYPPLDSNAAKVVRGGGRPGSAASSSKRTAGSSKSLVDDGSSQGVDPNAEVRGVKEYGYSGVFGPNSTQSDVYARVAAPLVEGLFPQSDSDDALGESALLFTLGVTNAGKTHTVMGTGFETKKGGKKAAEKGELKPGPEWGIIPRSLDHMLARIEGINAKASSGPQLQLYMSYLEIYNEQIYDLLPNKTDAPRRPCDGPPTLKLRESRRGRIFVRGLAPHAVGNVRQGLELAQMAKTKRHTASNNINATSSRSHSICQLEIAYGPPSYGKRTGPRDSDLDSECETDDDSSVCSRSSAGSKANKGRQSTIIWIVDLAGSERSKRTRSHTRHQKEAALINASLMNLMRCLREMLNHQPRKKGAPRGGVVPFRDSKLSHMFMNHLQGPSASRTSMVVNVNPAADDYDETQHVLGYAATARSVTISAVDYNRKRRMFAKEGKVKLSPKKAVASLVKKMSPKKRKGGEGKASDPAAKRLRSNGSASIGVSKKLAGRKPAPKPSRAVKSLAKGVAKAGNDHDELERLREENFELKVNVDDLGQQLARVEAETRNEVVDMMDAQLQESKSYYEERIAQLKEQIANLQSTKASDEDNEAELIERIDECEEEMKRMREDHAAEVEDLTATHLQLNNEHQAAMESQRKEHKKELRAEQEKGRRLEEEAGALRHRNGELEASHNAVWAKYQALLAAHQASLKEAAKENPAVPDSPSYHKLSRKRMSNVAVSSPPSGEDIVSPKKKKGGWFKKSPAKLDPRSPLGKGQVPSSGDGPPHVSFQTDVTVIEDGGDKQGGDSTPADNDDDASSAATPVPLHHSTRLKGYMTLLVSAIYNYIAAHDNLSDTTAGVMSNMCIYYDNLGNLVETPLRSAERVRFAMATSMITIIVTCAIILAHFDFCTPLRKSLWPKW
ncbi:hypothetical protein ACHAXT_007748 [Thalassiosira profunda]